jgi:ribosomal subunit interface protein
MSAASRSADNIAPEDGGWHEGCGLASKGNRLPRTNLPRNSAMQIQVNTDNHVEGSDELTTQVESTLENALSRFTEKITRVEVQLSDENSSQKAGGNDKRCVLEARLNSMKPIKVSADGSSLEQALEGAAKKLAKLLGRTLERLDDPRGRTSYAGEPSA